MALASPSVMLIEIGEPEAAATAAIEKSTIEPTANIDFVVSQVTLQDLLPSLSAITGAAFRASGPLNYKLEKFSFNGKTQELPLKITSLLPVGYFGGGESYDFYSLDAKISKTYDPARFDILKLTQRFNAMTVQSSPKLGFNRLASGAVVFEGPKSLFAELEKDIAKPVQGAVSSTALIKGGLKSAD